MPDTGAQGSLAGCEEMRLRVVADPGLPYSVAAMLAGDRLPALLQRHVSAGPWRVEVESRMLPLDENGTLPLVALADEHPEGDDDLTVYLTELPRGSVARPVLADISTRRRAALVSLPASGSFRLGTHLARALLHVAYRVHHGAPSRAGRPGSTGRDGQAPAVPAKLRRIPAAWDRPLKEMYSGEEDIDTSLVLRGWRGRARLLCGMVRANRPWRLVPHLASATAAAAATAAFGVFYSSIWKMADTLSPARMLLIAVLAIATMVAWLLLYNRLWDSPHGDRVPQDTVLYNASTLATLAMGVACTYVLLYGLTLVAALVVIDVGYLGTQLGHPAGIGDYAALAWLACSWGSWPARSVPASIPKPPCGRPPTAAANSNGKPTTGPRPGLRTPTSTTAGETARRGRLMICSPVVRSAATTAALWERTAVPHVRHSTRS